MSSVRPAHLFQAPSLWNLSTVPWVIGDKKAWSKGTLYISDSFMFLKLNNNFPPALLIYITVQWKLLWVRKERVGGGNLSSSFIMGQSLPIHQTSAKYPPNSHCFTGTFLWSLLIHLFICSFFIKPFRVIYCLKETWWQKYRFVAEGLQYKHEWATLENI